MAEGDAPQARPAFKTDDWLALAKAIQKRRNNNEHLGVVIKMLGREAKLQEVKKDLTDKVTDWMNRWGFSFSSMERADIAIVHESFVPHVDNRLFSEAASVQNNTNSTSSVVSDEATKASDELRDIVQGIYESCGHKVVIYNNDRVQG